MRSNQLPTCSSPSDEERALLESTESSGNSAASTLSGRRYFTRRLDLKLPTTPRTPKTAEALSPCTPRSVFTFDLPHSPRFFGSSHSNGTRSPRGVARTPLKSPLSLATPTSIFSFEFPLAPPTLETLQEESEKTSDIVSQLSTIEEEAKSLKKSTEWRSIYILAFVLFLIRMQFTVYFASLFPFLKEVDAEATPEFYALMQAAYSTAVAISAPAFGLWSIWIGQLKRPAFVSLSLMLISNVLYVCIDFFPYSKRFFMLFIRVIVGIAAGSSSILNSYSSTVSSPESRSTAAAVNDGAFSLGIAFGPIFQLVFSVLGTRGIFVAEKLRITMYTAPAMAAIFLLLIALFLFVFYFEEKPMAKRPKEKRKESTGSGIKPSDQKYEVVASIDRVAIGVCIVVKLVQMFIVANLETIGAPYAMLMFGWSRGETSEFNSMIVSSTGFIGFAFLLLYVWTRAGKRIDNRVGLFVGLLSCFAFLFFTFPWSHFGPSIADKGHECTFSWCSNTPAVPSFLYNSLYLMLFGVAFPLVNVHLVALFSQLIGSRPQAMAHGVATLVSSLSRVVGPLLVTRVFTEFGPSWAWLIELAALSSVLLAVLVFYRRLVPPKSLETLAPGKKLKYKHGIVYRF